ncbi:MAG: hypothetical protein HZA22_09600 [Nitrospirae bacterium]|nr:hypothetical protein [Nitrospirota bacterium]
MKILFSGKEGWVDRKRLGRLFLFMVLLVAAFVANAGFGYNVNPKLPRGVRLAKPAGEADFYISVPDKAIKFTINGYAVYNDIVIGEGGGWDPNEDNYTAGYFVIDAKNGHFQEQLSRDDWHKALHRYGITGEPKLHDPTIFDLILYFGNA